MAEKYTKPYVDALFEVAGSPEAVEKMLPALADMATQIRSSEELRVLFANPKVPRDEKKAVLQTVGTQLGLDSLGLRFVEILLANKRLPQLPALVQALRDRLDFDRRIIEAVLETAHPLGEEMKARLVKVLESRTGLSVRLKSSVRPEILGGFVIRLGSYVYDVSVAHRLEKVRQTIQNPS